MVGCTSGRTIQYYAYTTRSHRYTEFEERGCDERMVRADRLEKAAWEFALYSKMTFAEFKAMLEKRQEQQRQGTTKLQERLASVESPIEDCARKIRRIASLLGGTDDQDAVAAFKSDMKLAPDVKASLEHERVELVSKLEAARPITADEILDVRMIRQHELGHLESATFAEKQQYVERIDLQVAI